MLPPTLREFGHRRRRDLMHGPKSFQRRPPPSALPRLLDGRDGRDGTDGQQAARLPRERRSVLSPQRLRPHGPDLRPNEGYAGITPTPTVVRVFGTFVRSAGTGTLNLACWFNHLSQRYPPQGLERPPHRYAGADVILPSFTTRTLVARDVCRFKFAIRCPHAFAWLRALGDPGLGALKAQLSECYGTAQAASMTPRGRLSQNRPLGGDLLTARTSHGFKRRERRWASMIFPKGEPTP